MIVQRNIRFLKRLKLSPWRALALGSWKSASESTVYGLIEVPMDAAMSYVESLSRENGARITLTPLVAKALALTLRRNPEINSLIRWGAVFQRRQVDIFCHAAVDKEGMDLSGIVLRDADAKSVAQLSQELSSSVRELRANGDAKFARAKSKLRWIPTFALRRILDLIGFTLYTLNLWSPALGTDRDPFGSAMLTNVGSLEIDFALPPLVEYSRTPLILSMGAVREGLRMDDAGRIERIRTIKFGVTFDHRLMDGVHAARMAKTFRELLENPGLLDA